jgi:hypothetical protein
MKLKELREQVNALQINGKRIFDDKAFVQKYKDNPSFKVLNTVKDRLEHPDGRPTEYPGNILGGLIIGDFLAQKFVRGDKFSRMTAEKTALLSARSEGTTDEQTVLYNRFPAQELFAEAFAEIAALPEVKNTLAAKSAPVIEEKKPGRLSKFWTGLTQGVSNAWAAVKNFFGAIGSSIASVFSKKPTTDVADEGPGRVTIDDDEDEEEAVPNLSEHQDGSFRLSDHNIQVERDPKLKGVIKKPREEAVPPVEAAPAAKVHLDKKREVMFRSLDDIGPMSGKEKEPTKKFDGARANQPKGPLDSLKSLFKKKKP